MSELYGLATSSGGTTSPEETVAGHDFTAPPSRALELTIAVAALCLSVVALYLAQSIKLRMGGGGIDPKWWPTVLSIAAAALSACMLVVAFLRPVSRGEIESASTQGWIRMLMALTLSALYVYAWSLIGYVVPTLALNAILLWVFGLRGWKGLVVFPLATTAFIYGLFHYLLRVPL